MDEREDAELSALIKDRVTRYAAPPDLRSAIAASLAQAEAARAPASPERHPRWQWPRLGAAFAGGVLATLLVMQVAVVPEGDGLLTDEVVSAHVRSLMAGHLADVASTDQHTVKPWFAGRLDFSPPVADLSAQGYALTGGRLDYLDGHPVAALVYRHRAHTINVFVWPAAARSPAKTGSRTSKGFNVLAWEAGGMRFQAVSDLNARELEAFSLALRAADAPAGG